MKSIGDALRDIVGSLSPLGSVQRSLLDACGSHAATELFARHPLPPFDQSAMDGYAVRSNDTATATRDAPVQLVVAGESRAGGPLPSTLQPGTTQRIFTGAPLPMGADAVVMQEHARRDDAALWLHEVAAKHQHVRARGSDVNDGELLVRVGQRIGSGEVAVLASQDFASVEVFRPARVAILPTGDELRDIGAPNRSGSIVNSNAYALAAQVREAGAEPWMLPPVRDDLGAIRAALERALDADVVLCSGGVSVGDYDFVRAALDAASVEVIFDRVAMKPGKPLTFGRKGTKLVFGLPGNPVSAWVSFELFVRPALRLLRGENLPYPAKIETVLLHPHRHTPGRLELARGVLRRDSAPMGIDLARGQTSGSLTDLLRTDALAILDGTREHFAQGEAVPTLCLRESPTGVWPFT